MTAAQVTDPRSIRAANIVQSGNIVEVRPGIFHVRDTVSGSGQWHLVAGPSCGCHDFRRTGQPCKHLIAKNEFLKQRGDVCASCGAPTESIQAYVGGRGYLWFARCTSNREHKATRLS